MEQTENTQIEEKDTQEVESEQEKTFTQDEVNDIVEKRLARERKRLGAVFNDPREEELSKKEREYEQKKTLVDMREYILDNDKNMGLLQFVDLSKGIEEAKKMYGKLEEEFKKCIAEEVDKRLRGGKPIKKAPQETIVVEDSEKIREAFKL